MLDARQVNAAMSALIDGTFGCLDAAAETINARLGSSVSKGTLSKILSGQHQWPAVYIWALEDAAGRYPVSRLRGCGAPSEAARAGLRVLDAASAASREAISSAVNAAQSGDASGQARAQQEAREAAEAMALLVQSLEAQYDADKGQI
jgi:hypothetical protein